MSSAQFGKTLLIRGGERSLSGPIEVLPHPVDMEHQKQSAQFTPDEVRAGPVLFILKRVAVGQIQD